VVFDCRIVENALSHSCVLLQQMIIKRIPEFYNTKIALIGNPDEG